MEHTPEYTRRGLMLDCSRNAVMKPDALKKWIDLMSEMGYNTLMLYTEDTYEVKDNPYFGYARGRYSKAELQEIDRYAMSKGVEIVPCIQTLAHLNAIVNWPAYRDMVDCEDILLVGDDRVYDLVDKMFQSLHESLHSRCINVGMDEAHLIGRGKYYDLHGDTDRSELLVNHIRRVAEIGKKYGYRLSMWSDMFFRIASNGEYYNTDFEVTDEIRALIPDNVELIYWDYYTMQTERYDKMLQAHDRIKEGTWFAGAIWSWLGFAPGNGFTIEATKAALPACEKNHVKNVLFTMWGDDTAEGSKFSLLPAMFYVSEMLRGNYDEAVIKQKFEEKFHIPFDDFMLLDLTGSRTDTVNPSKYILFNDLFNGLMDTVILDGTGSAHAALSPKLAKYEQHPEWGYLFHTLRALCDVIELKADMGKRIRQAYHAGDKTRLSGIIEDCKRLKSRAENFYEAYEQQWMRENKGHGFDVQDIRIGGTIARIDHCIKRLTRYVSGEIDHIEELDDVQLDFMGRGTDYVQEDLGIVSFKRVFTANILSW